MIYTVRGPIDKCQIGRTLAHEHFKWENDEDFACRMYFDKEYNETYNTELMHTILPILHALKASGCQTIVEASPPLGGQNLRLLYSLSTETNVNIIPCTGLSITKYAYRIFPYEFENQLSRKWIQDFEDGLDTIDQAKLGPVLSNCSLTEAVSAK